MVTESTMAEAMKSMSPELAAAIVDAAGRISWVEKQGENTFHHYAYATAEQVIDEARKALNLSGLHLFHHWTAVRYDASAPVAVDPGDKSPRSKTIGRALVFYTVLHRGGSCLSFETSTPIIVEKGRPEDKAEMAALTANLAYTLRGLLLIPRGDEPATSVDERDDREDERPARGRSAGDEARAIFREPEERRPPPARTKPAETLNTEVPFADPGESIPEKGTDNGAPWADVVKGARERIATMTSVDEIAKGLSDFETIGVDEIATSAVKRAAVRRMIEVASSVPQLAIAGKLAQATGGSNAWHDETSNLYKTKRAALTTSKTEKAA